MNGIDQVLIPLIEFAAPAINELEILHRSSPEAIKRCPHTSATPSLRILVGDIFLAKVTEETLIAFGTLTAIDQLLYLKARKLSKIFKKMYPTLPIPVVVSGYCVRVLTPKELIQSYYMRNRKRR